MVVFAEFECKCHLFLKYKTGGVRLKSFIVKLLKWDCLRLSRNIFFKRRCIRVSQTSCGRCLTMWFLLNLSENITFFKYKDEWNVKMFMFSYRNDLVLGSIETFFDAYLSLKRATTGLWDGRFCWVWVKISHFFKQNWDLRSLLLNYGSDLILWKSVLTCLWNEPRQVSESVIFAEFE